MEAPLAHPTQNRTETADPKPKGKPRGRPFAKGNNANPGGRPKGVATRARELIGDDPQALLGVFLEIASDPAEKSADRISAAKEYLARAYGQAPAYAPVEGDPLELGDVDRAIGAVVDELAGRRETPAPRSPESGTLAAAS